DSVVYYLMKGVFVMPKGEPKKRYTPEFKQLKGLAACDSQTTSPFSCLNNFAFLLSNFWGALQK
ncbi:MAG: hypothetical protein U0M15_04960, partial [Bacillota bacterium]|nr:hypothetical protein [Bacillota bacterium]